MLNAIAYIGYGFVGKACHAAFKHNVPAIIIDPKYSSFTIEDLKDSHTELVFISIYSPTLVDFTVDASGIYDSFTRLAAINYQGVVIVKSTLPPDITNDLSVKFPSLKYIYSPEFLREATWEMDAITPVMIVLAGGIDVCNYVQTIYENHSNVWNTVRYIKYLSYRQASLFKYAINAYLASKVVFMNQLNSVFNEQLEGNHLGTDWDGFTEALGLDDRIGSSHLQVPGNMCQYGYGGNCFPKDVNALIGIDKNSHMSVLRETAEANTKLRLRGPG
jgi:UDPglucose 6-dehydrogenase